MQFQLADLYECLCDAGPEAPAVIAGDRRVSRAALEARANRLAHHLLRHGVAAGDHVGIYSMNRVEWVEALLACWKIRAAAVNVNYRYVTDELRYIWDNSDLVALVYERGFSERVRALAEEFPGVRTYLALEDGSDAPPGPGRAYEAALAAQCDARDFAPRSGDDIYLVYTGGTTGMPKGVLWRHEDLYSNVIGSLLGTVDAPEAIAKQADNPLGMRTLTLSPLMHGGGQFPFLITVLNGGVGLFPVSRRFDPDEVLGIVERERVTTLSIIGDAMGRPLAEAKLGGNYDTRSLQAISTGGAILTDPVRRLLRQAFGKVYLTGGIGSSEIGSAAKETRTFDARSGPRFRLDPGVAVLDEDLEPIAPGSDRIGRLARSGNIPLGYYKDPEKTADTFVTDARGVRWVLPGDYARVEADGTITLLGRGSQCINSGGEKVFPDEVESVLVRHPAVRHAAVVGVPDPRWQQRVVALVELEAAERRLDLEALQDHCRRHLAGYKVPRALLLTELQRTPTGKLDIAWAMKYAEQALGRADGPEAEEAQ
ncbi:MAG: acyl-CoA synthetase [Deltaproteobacteria bacterium]|nr:MAG: acyl-CoA synthetase [Deltaproteobacteria bacterium]